jgi:hypothetical protein
MGDERWGADKVGPVEDTRRTIKAEDRSTVIPRGEGSVFLVLRHASLGRDFHLCLSRVRHLQDCQELHSLHIFFFHAIHSLFLQS